MDLAKDMKTAAQLAGMTFEELDAYKRDIYHAGLILRNEQLAVEAEMQLKLPDYHAAQAKASPVEPELRNTGDGLLTRRELLERELADIVAGAQSVKVEGATAAATAGGLVLGEGA